MSPLFLYPLAFVGLLGVPALVAIYLFRNRFRRQAVSSLMLWPALRESRAGGRRLRRLQTPLLFVLELLAILLLVLAASEPHLRLRTSSRPLVVILDDSYSMLAGDRPARTRAIEALRAQVRAQPPYSIRFLLAGERAAVLGDPVRAAAEAEPLLEGWQCRAAAARLDEAIALGAELGGELAQVLVLTDHAPAVDLPPQGRVQWWAFGKARGNVAFVNAARHDREGLDRCLLEVANLDGQPRQVTVTLAPLHGGEPLRRQVLDLGGDETGRLILQLPEGTPALEARLDGGALPLDSRVVLLPTPTRPVRVDVRLRDGRFRDLVERAVRSVRQAQLTPVAPDLVIRDRDDDAEGGSAWTVQLIAEKDATAYRGPFVLDRAHPLTDGLSLRSVIWGAGKSPGIDGRPVLMAGNVPLIADSETPTGAGGSRHDLRLRLTPELSTVPDSPDWPILWWNIVQWRGGALPGLSRANVRLGEQVTLVLPEYRDSIDVRSPDGAPEKRAVKGRQVSLKGDRVGLYEVKADETTYRFAVNALNRDESDLRGCAEGRWGDWLDDTTLHLDYRGVAWVLLLGLLAVAVAHLLVMARARSAGAGAMGGMRS